jgi:hypothetical protein
MSSEGNPIAIPSDSSFDTNFELDRDANGDSDSDTSIHRSYSHQPELSSTLVTARSRRGSLFEIYGIEEETPKDFHFHPFEQRPIAKEQRALAKLATKYNASNSESSSESSSESNLESDTESEAKESTTDGPLSLPPTSADQTFKTAQEAYNYILDWSRSRGHGIWKGSSEKKNLKKNNDEEATPYQWRIQCNKAEVPRLQSKGKGLRDTSCCGP